MRITQMDSVGCNGGMWVSAAMGRPTPEMTSPSCRANAALLWSRKFLVQDKGDIACQVEKRP